MFQRKTTGSVVCPTCGSLVGVRDDKCYMCGRANPGLWGFAPLLRRLGADLGFVPIVIGGSAVLYVLTLLASGPGVQVYRGGISFLAPSRPALRLFGMSGAVPVFLDGFWWTLLTASWLHGDLLHIVFNMMWIRQLGPATAELIGPSRTVIVYVVAGICGFLLSSVRGTPFTLGASASLFGLFGVLLHYGRKSGSSWIRDEAMRYAVPLFIFGLIMPGIDNFAHAGGFVGGYAASAVMNPLKRETGNHLIVALGCLAATFIAIVYSVVHLFPLVFPIVR